jgi:hypothetical protein
MITKNAERIASYQRALVTPGGRPELVAADIQLTTGERRLGAARAYDSLMAAKKLGAAAKVADDHRLGDAKVRFAVLGAFEDELVKGRLDSADMIGDHYLMNSSDRRMMAISASETCGDEKIAATIRAKYKLALPEPALRT